jgi:hypothetical protein
MVYNQTHVLAGGVARVLPAGVAENHPENIREFWSKESERHEEWQQREVRLLLPSLTNITTLSYYRPLYVLYFRL